MSSKILPDSATVECDLENPPIKIDAYGKLNDASIANVDACTGVSFFGNYHKYVVKLTI